jgi:hypothetical protein
MLTFVLNIFVSIITDSFDKIRHDGKEHPEKYDADIFKYLSQKWKEFRYKLNSKKKSSLVTHENNTDFLKNFHIQTNRLIEMLAEVISLVFFKN